MKPEGQHREELVQELLQKERKISKLREEKKQATKDVNGRIAAQEERRDELLDLLEGRDHVNEELPLTTPGKDGKKPAPKPLKWEAAGANSVAYVKGGVYCLEPSSDPKAAEPYTVFWTAGEGKSKRLATATTFRAAKEIAEKDWLERGADAILENAGDGKLAKGPKGPPVARKAARR